jgi:hypothetical protein
MKTLTLFFLVFASNMMATTITVSNNASIPAQYTNLQQAIDAVNANDTILVHGSQTTYPTVTLSKALVIIGAGYKPQVQQALTTKTNINLSPTFSNNYLSGLVLDGLDLSSISNTINYDSVNNVIIKNCQVSNFGSSSGSAIKIKNSLIYNNYLYNVYLSGANIIFSNNIVRGIFQLYSYSASVTNNLFGWTQNISWGVGGLYANNIFYSYLSNSSNPSISNATFNNNILFNHTVNLPYNNNSNVTGNTGGGNLLTDPKLIAPGTSIDISGTNNYGLQSNSPAKNAGTDGRDIGITGGSYPWIYLYTMMPAVPYIKSMDIQNSTVPNGGTLKVVVNAQKRD